MNRPNGRHPGAEKQRRQFNELVEALIDVVAAATGSTNGKNITEGTRLEECASIARSALARVVKL